MASQHQGRGPSIARRLENIYASTHGDRDFFLRVFRIGFRTGFGKEVADYLGVKGADFDDLVEGAGVWFDARKKGAAPGLEDVQVKDPDAFVVPDPAGDELLPSQGFLFLAEASQTPPTFSFPSDVPYPRLRQPIVNLALSYADQVGGGLVGSLMSVAAPGADYFGAFAAVVEHFGGLDKVSGKRIVELGASRLSGTQKPIMCLRDLGADVTLVDTAYPRDEGVYAKSDVRKYLRGLKDDSVDAVLSFLTLEVGADLAVVTLKMADLLNTFMGGSKEGEAIIRQRLMRDHDVKPGSGEADVINELLAARPEQRGADIERLYKETLDLPENLRDAYDLIHRKLRPGGVAAIMNAVDAKGLPEDQIRDAGFEIATKTQDTRYDQGKGVLRILIPKK